MRTISAPTRAAAGMFLAWAVHDLEELLTFPAASEQLAGKLAQAPWAPARALARHVRMDRKESALAVALVGSLVATASARGITTEGRSRFFQSTLAVLGGHVLTHAAGSIILRGYSSGVVTAVLVVAPFSMWARRKLRAAGVLIEGTRPYAVGTALALPTAVASHALARFALRR